MLRRVATNLLLGVASVALVLGALEGSARLLHLRPGFFLHPTTTNCLRRSPLLSMEFRPNCVGRLHDTPVRTNARGFRGAELRDDGAVPTILALGDSCTWGWRVPEDASYPAVLQRLLDARQAGGRYQVVNGGVPGYTSHQGVLDLRVRGLALRPAIVVIAYGFNDIFPTGDVEEQLAQERRFMPVLLADDFLLDHSVFYGWLRRKLDREAPRRPVRVSAEKYKQNLAEMVRTSHAAGARAALVSFWQPSDPDVAYRSAVFEVGDELGAPAVEYTGPRIDVVHPDADGYRTLAETILGEMDAAGWLSQKQR